MIGGGGPLDVSHLPYTDVAQVEPRLHHAYPISRSSPAYSTWRKLLTISINYTTINGNREKNQVPN
jgi:hypothetical protein